SSPPSPFDARLVERPRQLLVDGGLEAVEPPPRQPLEQAAVREVEAERGHRYHLVAHRAAVAAPDVAHAARGPPDPVPAPAPACRRRSTSPAGPPRRGAAGSS